MPLKLSLIPTRASFCSGDFLTATLEISNENGLTDVINGPVDVATVNVDFSGFERIDRSWVSTSYQPILVQHTREGKREVRQILRTPPARLVMQDTVLMPGESRRWLLRFRLSRTMPPSFKGMSTRYSYQLQATAQYALHKHLPGLPGPSSIPLSSSAAVLADSHHHDRGPSAAVSTAATTESAEGGGSWSRKGSSGSLAQAGSLPVAPQENVASPSRYQTVEASAAVHLWPAWDPNERRGGVGTVAAGEDAELRPVGYQLGYSPRDLTVDFQELGRDGEAAGIGKGFAFQQLSMEGQQWQPAFLTSIDHRPSVTNETPTFPVSASALEADKSGPLMEEDITTPLSELTLHPAAESEDAEGPMSASELRSARSAGSTGRGILTSPASPGEAALRSYNLRMGDSALVRVALHAPSDSYVALGSVLAGTLDFRASQEAAALNPGAPRCVQVAVLLETEEIVNERWQSSSISRQQSSIRKVWDEHVEISADLVLTHFMFSLPSEAPASFATHLVSLRWVLRFEFTTSVAKPAGWLSGGPTPERIAWALPLLVRPPALPAS